MRLLALALCILAAACVALWLLGMQGWDEGIAGMGHDIIWRPGSD